MAYKHIIDKIADLNSILSILKEKKKINDYLNVVDKYLSIVKNKDKTELHEDIEEIQIDE